MARTKQTTRCFAVGQSSPQAPRRSKRLATKAARKPLPASEGVINPHPTLPTCQLLTRSKTRIGVNSFPDDVWGAIFSYVKDEEFDKFLDNFRAVNRTFKGVIDDRCTKYTWKVASKVKFGSLLSSRLIDGVESRNDYFSLWSKRDYAIWIIKRAMARYREAHTTLSFLTSWTPEFMNASMDPCIICGIRWSRHNDRCEDCTCPYRHLVLPFRGASWRTRGKSLHDIRLFVCKTCGDKEPKKAMREIKLKSNSISTTCLCFLCAKRNARVVKRK